MCDIMWVTLHECIDYTCAYSPYKLWTVDCKHPDLTWILLKASVNHGCIARLMLHCYSLVKVIQLLLLHRSVCKWDQDFFDKRKLCCITWFNVVQRTRDSHTSLVSEYQICSTWWMCDIMWVTLHECIGYTYAYYSPYKLWTVDCKHLDLTWIIAWSFRKPWMHG